MALPPPNLPNVSAVIGHYSATGGATAINRWHVLSNGVAALEVFNRFTTAWQAAQLAGTAVGVRLHTIDVMRLDNLSATESFSTVGTKWDGSAAGQFMPALAGLVKYTSGFRGLASVGHTYVPFIAEIVNENGAYLPAGLAAIQTAWVTFVNTLSTQSIPLQVVSYGREATATLPAAPASNHTVTGATFSPILATQRNRQGVATFAPRPRRGQLRPTA